MTEQFTHFFDGTQVYPQGDWNLQLQEIKGCIFARREFEGELTFGNASFNGSDDYDFIMSYVDCEKVSYEIKCNGVSYWIGYVNVYYDYEVDEDHCTVKLKPYVSDEYDCFLLFGDTEYLIIEDTIGDSEKVWAHDNDVSGLYTVTAELGENTTSYPVSLYDLLYGLIYGYAPGVQCMDCDTETGFAGDIVSSFIWLDDYPDSTPVATNYVKGTTEWEEIFFYTIPCAREDLGSTEADCTGYDDSFTFNNLMGWLRDALNVYWYIDSNGDFRLEHLSYFEYGFADAANTDVGAVFENITTLISPQTGLSYAALKNSWSFMKEEMPSEEMLEMLDADPNHTDFVGVPIYYSRECTYNYPSVNRRTYKANVLTDLQMLIDDPDSVSSDGWLMLACKQQELVWKDDNAITGWTNGNYTTFTIGVPNNWIRQASHAGSPPSRYCYSNNIAVTNIGDQYFLHYYYPSAGASGTFQIDMRNGAVPGASRTVEGLQTLVADDAWHTLTFTTTANGNLYFVIIENSALGGQLGNGIGAEAKFYSNLVVTRWVVQYDYGQYSASWVLNGAMSVANCMEYWWQHGRVLLEGNMNGTDRTIAGGDAFESTVPRKLQAEITIPKCCEPFDWLNGFCITFLGMCKPYAVIEQQNSFLLKLLVIDDYDLLIDENGDYVIDEDGNYVIV